MRLIKVGTMVVNTRVFDCARNVQKLIALAKEASDERCTLVVGTELMVIGYYPGDQIKTPGLLRYQDEQFLEFVRATARFDFPTLYFVGVSVTVRGSLYNCVALVCAGKILGVIPKEALPGDDIFYETRIFARGFEGLSGEVFGNTHFGDLNFEMPFGIVTGEVCEDLWAGGISSRRALSGAEIIAGVHGSPFRVGKHQTRLELTRTRSFETMSLHIYCGLLGGNDNLVFDGPRIISSCGQTLLDSPRWKEGLVTQVVDLETVQRKRLGTSTWRWAQETFLKKSQPTKVIKVSVGAGPDLKYPYPIPENRTFFLPSGNSPKSPRDEMFSELREALVLGVYDYIEKTEALKRVVHLLSGGWDSYLTARILREVAERKFAGLKGRKKRNAIKEFLVFISLPTVNNDSATRKTARKTAKEFGATFLEWPINESVEIETREVGAMLRALGYEISGTTLENIQARIRGARAYNLSNSIGAGVPCNSNLNETAAGYGTILSDIHGFIGPILNLFKGWVKLMIELWSLEDFESRGWESGKMCLRNIPTAGLAKDQTDEKSLGPYEVTDALVYLLVYEGRMPVEAYQIIRQMFSDEYLGMIYPGYKKGDLKRWVKNYCLRVVQQGHKRVMGALGIEIGTVSIDFKRHRQWPIAQHWIEDFVGAIDNEPD